MSSSSGRSVQVIADLTVPELKELCRVSGLKVGGKKADLVSRLSGTDAELANPPPKRVKAAATATNCSNISDQYQQTGAEDKVTQLLLKAGYTNPDTASKCARLAIYRGYIVFNGFADELDLPAKVKKGPGAEIEELEVSCIDCKENLYPSIRELLAQCDTPGMDYTYGGLR